MITVKKASWLWYSLQVSTHITNDYKKFQKKCIPFPFEPSVWVIFHSKVWLMNDYPSQKMQSRPITKPSLTADTFQSYYCTAHHDWARYADDFQCSEFSVWSICFICQSYLMQFCVMLNSNMAWPICVCCVFTYISLCKYITMGLKLGHHSASISRV